MSNNGHDNDQDADFFDAVERYLPIVGLNEPCAIFSPFFGKQYECTVLAITADGYFVENFLGKYTFLLPFSEAKAAGLGDLQIGQSVIIFSTVLDERTGIWLATCHPLALDDHDLVIVQKAVESGEWVEVKVSGENARGLRLVCGTIGGFMFFSNIDWEKHRRNDSQPNLIGQTILVRIISCSEYNHQPCFYASEIPMEPSYAWASDSVEMGDSCPVKAGDIVEGTVTGLKPYGVFVNMGRVNGLISIAEIAHRFIVNVEQEFKIGERITVKVLSVSWSDEKSRWHIALSRKALLPAPILVSDFADEYSELD